MAYAVGRALASAGALVVTGGLGGVMAAACRGAAEAGGTTVGLLPTTDRATANPWVTVAVPTGLAEARDALVVTAADAVVAVGGSWGTLAEVALARRSGKTVVGLATWAPFDAAGRPVSDGIRPADGPVEAAQLALAAARQPRRS